MTPDAFDPRALGARPPPPRALRTLLVTGDSLAQPLDAKVARALARGDRTSRSCATPHIGTGISQDRPASTGASSSAPQVRERKPDAVVVFIGANEGFPMPGPAARTWTAAAPTGRPRTPTACGG